MYFLWRDLHLARPHVHHLGVLHAGDLEVKSRAEGAALLQSAQSEYDGSLVLRNHLDSTVRLSP